MMTAAIKQFTPVTPPPENQSFLQKLVPLQPPNPKMNIVEKPLPTPADFTGEQKASRSQQQQQQQQQQSQFGQTQKLQTQAQTQTQNQARAQSRMQPPPPPLSTSDPTQSSSTPQAPTHTQPQTPSMMDFVMDPKDMMMATRIAAFYQQRCQAITNYQQQRCQAWANTYRQKCHETMQAAMLVVAWYVRDRIRKRRRKQKDKFRRGLRERRTQPRPVPKGERVRRWVAQVPEDPLPVDTVPMDRVMDKEEASFSIDAEVPPDRDTKLFEMADNLIKSQYRNIEVPLMGVLSFDESESESEAGTFNECPRCSGRSEMEVVGDPPEPLQMDEAPGDVVPDEAGVDEEGYDEDEEDLYEDDDMEEIDEEELGSELVHGGGTGKGSRDNEEVSLL
ncbi:hypothetical protein jhhlp_001320 [Lomentospora prolificans]|uniref:Uncharacterized protein n=1 Tax=Lomentospora prolificans TaxID=41688 RepID=A0A2N3NHX4_9PEZI|nr:hypothetical protein jhhlp_001320 [Lomentospora prolificans]